MISDVDHGSRVSSLESGLSGMEDSMNQKVESLDSRMVSIRLDIDIGF